MSSSTPTSPTARDSTTKVSNFLRQIIESDLAKGTYATRRWAGSPGDAAHQATHNRSQFLFFLDGQISKTDQRLLLGAEQCIA